tara:strand:+ start:372 stop:575 length:204 start_codon:yes stop_codon:yes gene_type:complete
MEKELVVPIRLVRELKSKIEDKKKLFILRSLRLNHLVNDKSPSYSDGLSKGYTQGVIDTLKFLGLIT